MDGKGGERMNECMKRIGGVVVVGGGGVPRPVPQHTYPPTHLPYTTSIMREAHPSYKSAVRYKFVDDRRDHPLLPTQGTYFSVRLPPPFSSFHTLFICVIPAHAPHWMMHSRVGWFPKTTTTHTHNQPNPKPPTHTPSLHIRRWGK